MKKNNHTFVVLAYKESKYLEECINSLLSQSLKTNIVIATSTPNKYINDIAKKNKIKVIINKENKGIANDFNFAVNCVESNLITIAHQDDIYDKDYAKNIVEKYKNYKNALIFFTNYFEIRNNEKVYSNKNIKIKEKLLFLLKNKKLSSYRFVKRSALRFGNAICCPSVTFCKKNIHLKEIFTSTFTSNMDWLAWERLSKENGSFIYINKKLMGHRVHEESTTTKIIEEGNRTNEDYEMFVKFWPKWIAKILNKFYKNSEKSNKVK